MGSGEVFFGSRCVPEIDSAHGTSQLKTAIRAKFTSSLSFFQSPSSAAQVEETIGEGAWKDRLEAEKNVERWLAEYPGTFITVQGPPGSGKVSLVTRILKDQSK
jgi:hypothetical protein